MLQSTEGWGRPIRSTDVFLTIDPADGALTPPAPLPALAEWIIDIVSQNPLQARTGCLHALAVHRASGTWLHVSNCAPGPATTCADFAAVALHPSWCRSR